MDVNLKFEEFENMSLWMLILFSQTCLKISIGSEMAKKKWVYRDGFLWDWDGDGFVEMDGGAIRLWWWDFLDDEKWLGGREAEPEERDERESMEERKNKK